MRDALPEAQRRTQLGAAGPPPLVVGLGRDDRGDDGCGLDVLRALPGRVPAGTRLIECGDDVTTLLDLWADEPLVIAVDAIRSGRPPGAVLRLEVVDRPLDAPLNATSTHGFSLGQAVALGQALHRFPRRLVIYGIEAQAFDPGRERTPPVARAVGEVVRRIVGELMTGRGSTGAPEA